MASSEHMWCVAELAAYLQALVDAGKGEAVIYIEDTRKDTEGGLLLRAKFTPSDPSDDESGTLSLYFGDL